MKARLVAIFSAVVLVVFALGSPAMAQTSTNPWDTAFVSYFPHFAVGGDASGRYVTKVTTRATSKVNQGNVGLDWWGDDGSHIWLECRDFYEYIGNAAPHVAQSVSIGIVPEGVTTDYFTSSGGVISGWMRIQILPLPEGDPAAGQPSATAELTFLRQDGAGTVGQATVPPSLAGGSFTLNAFHTVLLGETQQTGIAIANPSKTPVSGILTLVDDYARQVGSIPFALPAYSQTARYLEELFPKFTGSNFLGKLLLQMDNGGTVAVTGMQLCDGRTFTFSTLQATAK
jgi:hypothetical protein